MSDAYNTNSVPHGGLLADIYRGQAAPVLLGTYKVESLAPTVNGVIVDRPEIDGGDNGWVAVEGSVTGSAVIQLATNATPTLAIGDFFTAAVRRDTSGNSINEVFVITQVGHAFEMNNYRKQSVNVRVNKQAA